MLEDLNLEKKEIEKILDNFTYWVNAFNSKALENFCYNDSSLLENSLKTIVKSFAQSYKDSQVKFYIKIKRIKFRTDGKVKIIALLKETSETEEQTFVFTLIKRNNEWKLCHLECILFPLFEIPKMPYKNIIDLSPAQVKWIRTEQMVANKLKLLHFLEEKFGRDFAVQFFYDGSGFKLSMDSWLPFLEGASQFAIYYAILEKNLHGSDCIVEKASDDEAVVNVLSLTEFEVIKRGTFEHKLSLTEYQKLYEDWMKERAEKSALNLKIEFKETGCKIYLIKK